jgi:hypothetical protein
VRVGDLFKYQAKEGSVNNSPKFESLKHEKDQDGSSRRAPKPKSFKRKILRNINFFVSR